MLARDFDRPRQFIGRDAQSKAQRAEGGFDRESRLRLHNFNDGGSDRGLDPIRRQCVYCPLNFPRKDANSLLESTDLFSKIISLSGKRDGLFLLSEALTLFRLQCLGQRRKAFFRYGLELGNAVSFLLQSIGKNRQFPLNGIPRFSGCLERSLQWS